MEKKRAYAVIDVGSNSIRYLGRGAKRLCTTRLAAGLAESGRLSDASMELSTRTIGEYAALARAEGLEPRAYATSAVRDAHNSADFLARVERETGVLLDVLSGEREAKYALLGVQAAAGCETGIIDIGGGSSQIVCGGFAASFPVGCVRAKDWADADGAHDLDSLRACLFRRFDGIYRFPRIFVPVWTGVGGTITTLAALTAGLTAYDRDAVNALVLTPAAVEAQLQSLAATPAAALAAHPLLLERHDVILTGALILSYILRGMGIASLRVSDADGMEGYRAYLEGCE